MAKVILQGKTYDITGKETLSEEWHGIAKYRWQLKRKKEIFWLIIRDKVGDNATLYEGIKNKRLFEVSGFTER